jgi:hypothetical protein
MPTLDPYEMRKIVVEELEHIPRDAKGSLQNKLRSIYEIMRMKSLGKNAPLNLRTPEDCLKDAIETRKTGNPDFEPEYNNDFFRIKESR